MLESIERCIVMALAGGSIGGRYMHDVCRQRKGPGL